MKRPRRVDETIGNQAGFMATRSQIEYFHNEACPGGFLPHVSRVIAGSYELWWCPCFSSLVPLSYEVWWTALEKWLTATSQRRILVRRLSTFWTMLPQQNIANRSEEIWAAPSLSRFQQQTAHDSNRQDDQDWRLLWADYDSSRKSSRCYWLDHGCDCGQNSK